MMGANPCDLATADEEGLEHIRRRLNAMLPEWTKDALCAEFDLATWFPGPGQTGATAFEICGRCAVRQECLDEALADETLDHGIRGGATANARKAMRRNRAQVAS